MLDTSAGVTMIACSEWPANWELQLVAGMISGIGGATKSIQSKGNIIIKEPEGKLATIWPFVISKTFFSIPLHPQDVPWFAFSIPSLNREAPLKTYHWLYLPQGLKCSLTICQWYVAHILSPIRNQFLDAIIHHYMDDILVCESEKTYLDRTVKGTIETIEEAGFEIREDKVQYTSPWTYLRL
ncbi:hypothetical protein HGM15179_019608 [Zosterops borbonicus]|uniref:ribonuclease H n=1 Tax=Zosterops borbonicus TaxID=364589 RepID=A0A8K1DBE9_9PASS|nr:hypothetical protein HGM15179_019608 [Zosterops borbonicus]